jgi:RimJ/RimL family protein N-acetyltransferase
VSEDISRRPAYRVETERLLLRCWAPEDAPVLRAALDRSDAHLRPWIPFMVHEPRSLDDSADWLRGLRANFDRGEHFRYGVWSRDGDELVGENMLLDRVGPGGLEIGYLTHLGFAGRGYASEATVAMVRLAFEVHGADRVEIHCAPQNTASAAIPARLGFTCEAILARRFRDTEGVPRDLMIWTLLTEDYALSSLRETPLQAWDCLGRPLLGV